MSDGAIDAARAIDALRRGWPVRIEGEDGAITVLAIEGADDGRLAAFDPDSRAGVLLSAERAATLALANQRDAATPATPATRSCSTSPPPAPAPTCRTSGSNTTTSRCPRWTWPGRASSR